MAKQEAESQEKMRVVREIARIAHSDGDDTQVPGLYGAVMRELLRSGENKPNSSKRPRSQDRKRNKTDRP